MMNHVMYFGLIAIFLLLQIIYIMREQKALFKKLLSERKITEYLCK